MAGCMMRNTNTSVFNLHWSNCSLKYLETLYKMQGDKCLWNEPKLEGKTAVCGNGIIEKGEDCDCGEIGCITHKCCDKSTCKFTTNSKCAFGTCCDLKTCSAHKSARLCRESINSCDLPEYCDGENIDCPVDVYRADGQSCPDDDQSICYGGFCGSRKLECIKIWGEEAKPEEISSKCYERNTHNDGCRITKKNGNKKCPVEDINCDRLQCSHHNLTANPVLSELLSIWKGECFAVLPETEMDGKYGYNLGLTLNGTNCGDGKFCLNTKCVSKSELLRDSITCDDCPSGVCNNLGHCHCSDELGGSMCLSLALGNSPPFSPSIGERALGSLYIFLVFILIWLIIFAIASLYYKIKQNENFPKMVITCIKSKCGRKSAEKLSNSVEDPKANEKEGKTAMNSIAKNV